MPTKPRDLNKPRIWKPGKWNWAVSHPYYCQELDQLMYSIAVFRTWHEAMQYVEEQLWPMYSQTNPPTTATQYPNGVQDHIKENQ